MERRDQARSVDSAGRSSGSRGVRLRFLILACLLVLLGGILPVGPAAADPAAEARKKLTRLNEQVEQLVEKYNQVNEDLKAARRRLKATNQAMAAEQKHFEELRKNIATMAATAYQNGDITSVSMALSAKDPQAILDQVAVFTHLSANRASRLSEFLASAQRLQRQQAQAKRAYDDVAKKAAELKADKAKVERAIAKQRRLVAKYDPPSSATGGSYTGPASGSTRAALNWAYSKIGTPYCYGGEGPSCYDCSGFTQAAWGAAGVSLPRTTNQQYAATRHVSWDAKQPGDLLFFNGFGHMGMYVGNGRMIHSPRTGKTVEVVPLAGYYEQNFAGASRP